MNAQPAGGPAYAEFDAQRGDTGSIGVVLHTQDVFTQEVSVFQLSGSVIYWIVSLPSGLLVKSTQDGGLTYDQLTGALFYPLTASFTSGLPDGPVRTLIRIVNTSSGEITTWLDGYIVPRG